MTLNPQTQSLVLSPHHHYSNPCFAPFLPSFLHIHKLSICIFLLVVFFFLSVPCLLSLQISCCFSGYSQAFLLFSYVSFSFHSPPFLLPSFCKQFSPIHAVFFSSFSLLLLTPLFFSLLRPSRWLVFVSLSLVAAAGSGLNNEITFAVGREAAHQTSSPVTLPANTHARVRPESVRTNPSHLHLGINICHTYARANKLYISRQMHGNRRSSETHARAHSQSLVLISCAHRPALRAECSRMEVNVLITLAATREAHFVPLNRDEERRLLPTESSKEQQMQKERTKCLTRNPSTPPPFFLVPAKIIA